MDYGFDVHIRDKDADVIYLSPYHMARWGALCPSSAVCILQNIQKSTIPLLLRTITKTSSLQCEAQALPLCLGQGQHHLYGSFSAMLLPGIRISFMVLTKKLSKKYNENTFIYTQTAGKTEQCLGNLLLALKSTTALLTVNSCRLYVNML